MKLIYDKIQFFGGAERVLLQIDHALNPTSIVTLCDVEDPAMNSIKGKTVCPKWGKLFIKLNYFIIFYPLVCLLSTLIVVKANLVFCYSSTCGKYFRIKSNKSILYTNFPARGIIEPEKFVKNRILLFVVKIFTRIFKYIEKIQYRKFDNIYCISTYTKKLLKEHYQLESEVLYCPTSEKFFARNKKYNDTKPFFVLVSLFA